MTRRVWALKPLAKARVGHLGTSTKKGKPLVVPICFAYHSSGIYSAIDEKPKRAKPLALRRVLNIVENPDVCLTVDEYNEDWRQLGYVLVYGRASLLTKGREHKAALMLLRKKYPQYESMKLDKRPIIKIKPLRIIEWKASSRTT